MGGHLDAHRGAREIVAGVARSRACQDFQGPPLELLDQLPLQDGGRISRYIGQFQGLSVRPHGIQFFEEQQYRLGFVLLQQPAARGQLGGVEGGDDLLPHLPVLDVGRVPARWQRTPDLDALNRSQQLLRGERHPIDMTEHGANILLQVVDAIVFAYQRGAQANADVGPELPQHVRLDAIRGGPVNFVINHRPPLLAHPSLRVFVDGAGRAQHLVRHDHHARALHFHRL